MGAAPAAVGRAMAGRRRPAAVSRGLAVRRGAFNLLRMSSHHAYNRLEEEINAIVIDRDRRPAVFVAKIEAACARHGATSARVWIDGDLVKMRSHGEYVGDPPGTATACFEIIDGAWAFVGHGDPPLARRDAHVIATMGVQPSPPDMVATMILQAVRGDL